MMSEDYDDQSGSPDPPKRRRYSRVSRACNECRARKIRCNGRQPCEPCEDFERHCTFTSTKGQRLPGAPRTKVLEDRLRRARTLIGKLQLQNPSTRLTAEVNNIFDSPPGSPSSNSDATSIINETPLDDLENMMDGKSRLIPSRKSISYYGGGSELAYLHETYQFFVHDHKGRDRSFPSVLTGLFDSPISDNHDLTIDAALSKLLPSRELTSRLLDMVFTQVYHLNQFLHEATFQQQVDRIYDLDRSAFEEIDRDFLPLFHSVIALGYLFNHKVHQEFGCKEALSEGMRHFLAARQMLDPIRLRDIIGLQTLICLAFFLIATARIVSAHTYVSLAVSASLRMGLHSQASCEGLTPLSQEIKKRVFWTVVKIDTFSSVILGIPPMIDLDHVDQLKPSGLSRDYSDPQQGGSSLLVARHRLAGSSQFLDLLMIISRLVRKLYPKTDGELRKGGPSKRHTVTSATIAEVEEEFKTWRQGLVDALGPNQGQDKSSWTIYGLEMAHNFGHIILYRPFLHYLAKVKNVNAPDAQVLHFATSCVKISRFTITRSEEMLKHGQLMPAAWFSIYTIFLAVVTLIFFLTTQHGNKEYAAIHKETERGIQILHRTSCLDTGSRRCLDALRLLIQRSDLMINLDIDILAEGAGSVCETEVRTFNERSNPRREQPRQQGRQQHDAHLQRRRSLATGTGNSQLPHRFQTHSAPAVSRTVTQPSLPLYGGRGMTHSAPIPSWSGTSVISEPPTNPHRAQPTFPYQQPSQAFEQELSHEELEYPHMNSFLWPLPVEAELDVSVPGGSRGRQTPTAQALTPEDVAALMQMSSGENLFLGHNNE